jgi:hypothetical protein
MIPKTRSGPKELPVNLTMAAIPKVCRTGVKLFQRLSIADPNDGGMLDVVGFDAAAPELIADFIRA